MHNYKGQLRRQQDYTPTKSSWDSKQYVPFPKNDTKIDKNDKYEVKPEARYDTKEYNRFEKSELSYYQSQGSRVLYDCDHSERPARSQVAMSDDRFVFNDILPVKVKSYEREEYELGLRIQIQAKIQKNQHTLLIYITDDSNPKFLWTFVIKEVDFMTLKNQQKLKVSFSGFPEMLQNLFRECQQNVSNENRNNYLVLSIKKGGEGKLSFVESNRYKQSTHLEFNFKLANDEQIKDHLSNKLMQANTENQQNRNTISNLENTLSDRMREIQKKDYELKQKVYKQFEMQEKQKITELQEKSWNQLSKSKKESQFELKDLKTKLTSEIDTLTKQKSELLSKLTQSKERVAILQSTQREQSIKISRQEQDLNKSIKEADQLRSDNRQLSEKRYQNQKTITQLTCKIESLKSELEDKKTIITSTVQLKQTNNNQITAFEQLTSDQKRQIVKLQNKVSELEGEMNKLSCNNNQFQEKIIRQKQKLQQRGEIIKEQEKEIKQMKKNQTALERDNQKLRYEKDQKENKLKNFQEQLEKVQKKFQDQQAMVVYLQKNLNERPGLRTTANYLPNSYQSSSFSGVNREVPSQLSANSNFTSSRLAFTDNTRTDKFQKYEPSIKRYEQRSKSPISNRLAQQREPQQQQNVNQNPPKNIRPYPVKFKMSQPAQK